MHPRLRAVALPIALAVNTPLAKARLRRAVAAADGPVRLELGGKRPRPGWLVTDVSARARCYLDATAPWPFPDGSLAAVYADNVIEHIPLPGARVLYAEAHRCLRPGGVLRLVTPDIRGHVELYLQGPDGLESPVARRYRAAGRLVEHPVDLVRMPIGQFGHHLGYVYDDDALTAELRAAGFTAIEHPPAAESAHVELRGLELRGADDLPQLVVEATR